MLPNFNHQFGCSLFTSFSCKLRGNYPCIIFHHHLSFVFSAMLSFICLVPLCNSLFRLIAVYTAMQVTWYLASLTAHSCSQHGPAAASLTSARPRNVIPVPETASLLGVEVHCLSSSQCSITLLTMSRFAMNYSVRNVWHSSSLQCLTHTAVCFELLGYVFKTKRKRSELRALCFLLTSLPLRPRATMYQVVWPDSTIAEFVLC
jgi:hypothetical protein